MLCIVDFVTSLLTLSFPCTYKCNKVVQIQPSVSLQRYCTLTFHLNLCLLSLTQFLIQFICFLYHSTSRSIFFYFSGVCRNHKCIQPLYQLLILILLCETYKKTSTKHTTSTKLPESTLQHFAAYSCEAYI